jgi:hypothetical protein
MIQATYRTGEGRKMRTDDFFISRLEGKSVWLDETTYDQLHQMLRPSGVPSPVPLEMIHVIVADDKIIYPVKRIRRKEE